MGNYNVCTIWSGKFFLGFSSDTSLVGQRAFRQLTFQEQGACACVCVCVCYACVLGYVPNANIIQAKDLMKRAQAIRISQFMTQEYGIAGYK